MADRVAVMYLGNLIETGSVVDIFYNPKHPYTKGLIRSVPDVTRKTGRLEQIAGSVPTLDNMPTGCSFNPRCPLATDQCREQAPELHQHGDQYVACWEVDHE